jgi:AraC-like DNA-binding protein
MKIVKTEITPIINSYISIERRNAAYFKAGLHYHPELELVYVTKSFGKRIVGQHVDYFEAGDMVFLGANLPHVWLSDETYYQDNPELEAESIVVYFNRDIFSPSFYSLPESRKINELLTEAKRGIVIKGETCKKIAQKLALLLTRKDFELFIGLFEIIALLIKSKDLQFVNHPLYSIIDNSAKSERMASIFTYMNSNFHKNITQNDVAKLVNLTPQSFCRFFKSRTKIRFIDYLNELRINRACRMLFDTDKNVSEIAYACGFNSVSNFNKTFKRIKGSSPKEYKLSTDATHV